MCERDALYKDAAKHLRVVRNVVRSHKTATGASDIDRELMTPYEIGRMIRSCTRLGRTLTDLLQHDGQLKIVAGFVLYMDGLGISGSSFCKPGNDYWHKLNDKIEKVILDETISHLSFESMVTVMRGVIDSPLSEAPGRMMLLKLSV